jgi:protease I
MADQEMNNKKKVAILTESGFEQSELLSPREALEKAGYQVEIVSPRRGSVKAWDKDHWGVELPVDKHITDVTTDDYDGLLLPGGVLNPDQLRMDTDSVLFVQDFFASGKVVAAICHGPQMLIEANVVEGRQLTSYPSIRVDISNAGGLWVDQEVVVDSGLITSRKPDDLPAFNRKFIEELQEGRHTRSKPTVFAKDSGNA